MKTPSVSPRQVTQLWFRQQGLADVECPTRLTRRSFTNFLETTGGLQLDSINVLDRAHYLTLWSRFGNYNRTTIDRWVYADRKAYEYWGHEATILPISHLPVGKRRMLRFPPPSFKNASWWSHYNVSPAVKRRVLDQLRKRGPLESGDIGRRDEAGKGAAAEWTLPKAENRALKLLWHAGRVAIRDRRHFRQVFDLAENVYPDVDGVSTSEYFDSWLLAGLRGNGITSERHLTNYYTSPKLTAKERSQVIERCLKKGTVCLVKVDGSRTPHYALPDHLAVLSKLEDPVGTTFLSPFDSLLWQRQRAEDLLGFRYRVEIYLPKSKRVFGYYTMPILHDGRLVGRIDPKLHRDRDELVIESIQLEDGFRRSRRFDAAFRESLHRLGEFVHARKIGLPVGW